MTDPGHLRFPVDLDQLFIESAGARTLVLTSPEALLHFVGFRRNPYVACGSPPWGWCPAALVVDRETCRLLVAAHDVEIPTGFDCEICTYEAVRESGVAQAFWSSLVDMLRAAERPLGLELLWASPDLVMDHDRHDLRDISSAVRRVAARKALWEIAGIRRACELASLAQRVAASKAAPGVSELELYADGRAAIEEVVGAPALLAGDVVAGARAQRDGSGDPSARGLVPGDTLICDFAPIVDGFFGDSCSTVVVGGVPPIARRAVTAVCRALEAAASCLQPGVAASAVDAAARHELQLAGFSCPHYIGHGVGHSQLDFPLIDRHSTATLEDGHIVALEPGVYLPGVVAARAEHVFLIRDGGAVRLTRHELVVEVPA